LKSIVQNNLFLTSVLGSIKRSMANYKFGVLLS